MGCLDPGLLRAGANSVLRDRFHLLPLTTEQTHLRTVLSPLSPGFRGRGVGGEGAIRVASAIRSEAADLAPRTDAATRRRERVFDGAAPSSPALLGLSI